VNEALDIRVLGPLDVRLDDVSVELGGAKPRAILAMLALQAGRVVSVDQLVEAGWGAEAPLRAVNSVPVYISQLRKALGASRIETRAPGYALNLDTGELDLSRFEDQVRAASIARGRGDHAAAASLLREALNLWRGPALADLVAEPFFGEAARLEELRLVATEDRVEAELAMGAHQHLVGELEALVSAHPLRERLRAQVMLALYRSDRQAEALRAYQDLRRVLGEELGIEPSRELASLEEAMLLQRPELEWRPAPAPATPLAGGAGAEPLVQRPGPPMLKTGTGPFVGRDEELAKLTEIWDRVCAGRLELALVAGEPGIGKTRLMAEFAAQAGAGGAIVLYGRCDDDAPVPYRPFVEALRLYVEGSSTADLRALSFRVRELVRVVPELVERLPELEVPRGRDSDTERYFLFEAVVALLAAAAGNAPVLLILDDLHWADKPSRLLLRHVTQRLTESPMFVLTTSRDTEVLTEVDRERRAHRIRLGGLTEPDVATLLKTWNDTAPPGLVTAVHAETDGNPFFVGEVLRHLTETAPTDLEGGRFGIPEGVRELLSRRLERLGPDARRLLQVGAVVGREFDVAVLEEVVDLSADAVLDALEELERAGILVEMDRPPGRYRFAHNLVREAIYDELAPTRRARSHQDVGRALERVWASRRDLPLAELAHHFSMAAPLGETARAIDYARRAAEQAASQLAYDAAISHYGRALELVGDAPTRERAELLLALGDAEWRVGSTERAPRTFAAAATIARTLKDPELLGLAAVGKGAGHLLYFFESGMLDEDAVALLEEALVAVGEGDSAVRVELLGTLARLLYLIPPFERRVSLIDEAIAMAERLGLPETMAVARFQEYNALRTPFNASQRLEQATRLLQMAIELNDRELLLTCHLFRVMDLLELGDIDGVDAEFGPQLQLADELRQPNLVWITTLHRAMRATLDGRFEEGEALAQEALELGMQTEMAFPAPVYGGQIAVLRTLQGRADEIEAPVRALITGMPYVPAWQAGLAFALVEAGRLEEARVALEAVVPVSEVPEDIFFTVHMASVAEACAALGDVERAAPVYDALLPLADQNVVLALGASCWGSVSHYLGLLAACLGRLDDADTHFQQALDRNGRMGAWPLVARTQVAYARMLIGRGQPGDLEHADSLLDAAEEIAEELRMVSLGLRAQELRAQLSVS
jgi:DNA-binding SARP family transcriptional activator/tetratricopeptide (TPR) repeat protein